jgi:NTP pyrophosphatase (non-canonical NTP hydrolase)
MKTVEQQAQETAARITDIEQYGRWTEKVWFSSPGQTELTERDITIMTLGLPGEVGEVTEIFKKKARDGTFDINQLKKELGDVAYYWARICKAFGLSPMEVLQCNVEKIESRKLRGTLRGSGDDR